MPDIDFLGAVERETRRFFDVLGSTEPSARVPSCPDWDAADLGWHLATVQWFWASVVEERLQTPDGMEEPTRPSSYDEVLAFGERQSARLVRLLTEADPATEVYTWSSDHSVGFIRRRQAHEALIHRLDAELAAGSVTPLEPVLAADGVVEVLDVMYGGLPPWGRFEAKGPRVDVACTDVDLVVPVVLGRFTGTDPEDRTSHDEDDMSVGAADPAVPAAATVSGTADDLDAWLWRRRDEAAVTVTGDSEAFEGFTRLLQGIR